MINRINIRLSFSQDEQNQLDNIKPHNNVMWDTPPNDEVKSIKSSIRNRLLNNQSYICAYCGLELGGTSEGQIEHIAPKAKYPHFTFEKDNLAMACHYCNGFSKKGNHHTIAILNQDYSNCSFKLVHPYYDTPNNHYGWVSEEKKILIQSKSDKGTYSIKMLKLDDSRMSELRGKKIIAEIVLSNGTTPQIDDKLIQDTINFKL
jgi:uncharacterized protein (TIGR02646 family)